MFRRPSSLQTQTQTNSTTKNINGNLPHAEQRQPPKPAPAPDPPLSPMSIPPTPGNENGFYFSKEDIKKVQQQQLKGGGEGGYVKERALDDLPLGKLVLHTFMGGKMLEAEKMMLDADPHFERLYPAAGWGVLHSLKALMSFEETEIHEALTSVKHAALIAQHHRKPATSLAGRLAGLVVGASGTSGVGFIRSMTPVERHAELVYSECLLQKAILGIASSGDWLTFIKEFLNIRSATAVYRTLNDYIKLMDAEATARGEGPIDKSIDQDFRSGVSLGTGCNALVLSLLPDTVSNVAALFGYKGDRIDALNMLRAPGGWSSSLSSSSSALPSDGCEEPAVGFEEQGLRRTVSDLTLLVFNLYISIITGQHAGVSIAQARSILKYNLGLYPEGVFFLFLQGRLNTLESRPHLGIELYKRGMAVTQYLSLKNVAQWEIGLCCFSLCDWKQASDVWAELEDRANWSKTIYAYALAVSLYETGSEENRKKAEQYFTKAPTVTQRIGGKSIPMEKWASRKCRKYDSQGHRLLHPGIEMSYMLSGLPFAPRTCLLKNQIPALRASLDDLSKASSSQKGYWDDLALVNVLYGVCLRYVAYPNSEAIETEEETAEVEKAIASGGFGGAKTREEVGREAEKCLKSVIENGTKIELDHQLVYCAHLDLGKLYACLGDQAEAKRHLEMVASGKPLEVNAAGRKGGKYSMQNSIHVKSVSALQALESGRRL